MILQNFQRSAKGNISILFAMSLMTICGVVGLSVDYARLIREKQDAQNALDASILAAATEFQKTGNKRKAKAVGVQHMTASFPNVDEKKLNINVTNRLLTGSYNSNLDNTFMTIIGKPTSSWSIDSRIAYSRRAVTDFSLAIDVSNSMITHDLMAGLRSSLTRFSRQAFENTNPEDVSVTVVPFANAVSFEQNYDRWLDGNNGYSQTKTFIGCYEYELINNRNLLSTAGNSNRIAAFDRRKQPKGANVPYCPEANSNVAFYINNEADLNRKFRNLTTGQGTNTAEGLTWAWRTLSPEWQGIFNESTIYPRPISSTNNKVLILLTDGRPLAFPSVKVETDIDEARLVALAEFKEVCDQIIAAGNIDLYSIVYGDIMNENQRKAIRKCIAGNGRSFWGGNTNQLSSIFTRIVSMNSELALSK